MTLLGLEATYLKERSVLYVENLPQQFSAGIPCQNNLKFDFCKDSPQKIGTGISEMAQAPRILNVDKDKEDGSAKG